MIKILNKYRISQDSVERTPVSRPEKTEKEQSSNPHKGAKARSSSAKPRRRKISSGGKFGEDDGGQSSSLVIITTLNPVNDYKKYIQLDNGANRQVLNDSKYATRVLDLKSAVQVQSFIPGQATLMKKHLLIENIGYFYLHKDSRNIVSEHQLEKNGFTITDVKDKNMSVQRVVSKNGQSFSFLKHEGIWLAPIDEFFAAFATPAATNATIARPVTRGYKKLQQQEQQQQQQEQKPTTEPKPTYADAVKNTKSLPHIDTQPKQATTSATTEKLYKQDFKISLSC
jgi:hypothetical protein